MPRTLPEPSPSQRKALDDVARFAEERASLDKKRARIDEMYVNSILAAADAGLTATQIASRTPHSYQAIQQILNRHGRTK